MSIGYRANTYVCVITYLGTWIFFMVDEVLMIEGTLGGVSKQNHPILMTSSTH